MKKVILAIAVISCLSFQSCKKCWKCSPQVMVDGTKQTFKTCDKEQMEAYETIYFTDMNGNITSRVHCN